MNKKIIGIIFTSFLIVNTIPIVISIEENMMDNYDDNQISYVYNSFTYGTISAAQMTLDVFHTIEVTITNYNYVAYGAIVLVYFDPWIN